jgi:cytidylate kinase
MKKRQRLRIAIDGPASSGKGTVGALLAERLGCLFVDTGAMYRAVALLAVREGVNLADDIAVGSLAESATIEFRHSMGTQPHGYATVLNGVDVSEAIRSPEIDVASSKVAVLSTVRDVLVKKQKRIAQASGVVMEGRDIATVVIPDADVKIYLTASVEERARRRYEQRVARGLPASMEKLIEELAVRDQRDSKRSVGPLTRAPGAFVFDSSGLTVEETVARLEAEIRCRFPSIDTRPECAVRAAILNSRGQVLLIRSKEKWHGRYVCPGGRVETYETLEAALQREVKEEVGLDVRVQRLVGVTEDISSLCCSEGDVPHHVIFVDFLCEPVSRSIQLDQNEAEECTWVYPTRVSPAQTTRSTYSLLQKVHRETVVREKLVRDQVPELMERSGKRVHCRQAVSDEEYEQLLRLKLVEEAGEFAESGDVEEVVDVLEVLDTLLQLAGISAKELAELKKRKATQRGKFDKRLVCEVGR